MLSISVNSSVAYFIQFRDESVQAGIIASVFEQHDRPGS